MINNGEFNKKIKIYKSVLIDNGGFKEQQKELVYSCYAKVNTTRGFTLIASGSDFEKAYTNFTIFMPKKTTITRDMVIVYKNYEYTIEYLNNIDEDDLLLEIQAKRVVK